MIEKQKNNLSEVEVSKLVAEGLSIIYIAKILNTAPYKVRDILAIQEKKQILQS